MTAVAFSVPGESGWRWRIENDNGETIQESNTVPCTLPITSRPMPPTCSTLTWLMLRFWIERSVPSATILMPSPSAPLPLIIRLEIVSWLTFTPWSTTISMTGPPLLMFDWILAPPKSMLIGPWSALVRWMTIGELTE